MKDVIYDPDVLVMIVKELSREHRFVEVDKVLFLYRERKGLTIKECALVYELIYQDDRFDKGWGCGPQFKSWLRRRKSLLRVLRGVPSCQVPFPFMKNRKYAVFITKLHKAVREHWRKAREEGRPFPSYSLIRVRKD
ncbi:hypothetical protein DRO32_03965 [Candidatus Bathyarchaeota archaeon]|nr:MAG: hypothetical protein DRO32_03965 [Candidatus Bathyarchaeota archaeon]